MTGGADCGVLLIAKAPVPGLAKTRIGAVVGAKLAADLAAAALLDTLDAVEDWPTASHRLLAITGSLQAAARGSEIAHRLTAWEVVRQHGVTFADRLVSAHRDAAARWGPNCSVVQIGMDTPHVTGIDLEAIRAPLADADVALGPALDGGWWGIATGTGNYADQLIDVPMSQPDTAARTVAALEAAGAKVELAHQLRDMDEWADAVAISARAPHLRVAHVLDRLAQVVA